MSNLAEQIDPQHTFLEAGEVVACNASAIVVTAGARRLEAARATSCLLAPEIGDRVLVAFVGEECFVMGVLAREGDSVRRLEVDGGLELCAKRGRLTLGAQEGIDLTTPGDTNLTSGRLQITALEGRVMVEKLQAIGGALSAELGKLEVVAERVSKVCGLVHERIKRSFRFVEGLDQVRAATIDYRGDKLLRMHAEDTVITANRLTKIDGEQIHIG